MGTNKWEIKVQKEKIREAGRGWINIDSIFYQYLTTIIPQEQEGIILILQRPFLYEFLSEIIHIYWKSIILYRMPVLTANMTALTFICYYFWWSFLRRSLCLGVSQPQLCHAHFWGRNMVISKCGSSEIRQTIKMNLILTKDGVSQSTKPFTQILILRPNIFLSSF